MEFLGQLNVNITVLVALVGIVEFIKTNDVNDKLKKFYPLFAYLLSMFAGVYEFAVNDYGTVTAIFPIVIKVLMYSVIYFGIASLMYQTIIKLAKSQIDKIKGM